MLKGFISLYKYKLHMTSTLVILACDEFLINEN